MRMLLLAGSMPRASNGQTRIPLVATLPWVSEDPKVTHVVRPVLATMHGQGGTRGGTVLSDAVHAPTHPCGCWGNTDGCYLVDPASSHMLVSKIKPCMFKKLVVGPWVGSIGPPLVCTGRVVPSAGDALLALTGRVVPPVLRTTAKAFAKDVFINQERKLGARRRSDTVLVSTINDADQGSADVAFRTPLAPYEKSKSLGSGGSMVARLKLKGIDGRAPPGVEPAA
ncbi:hypothetical protein VNO80_35500 [Phaseolus coccineus]|uniref:Uncharacterized protein n=1 Tax=Phaseolus coccineus TaxID=3886 RepID=A0AAN9KUT9_PHACN